MANFDLQMFGVLQVITHHVLSKTGFQRLFLLVFLIIFHTVEHQAKADCSAQNQVETWYGVLEFNHTEAPLLAELLSSQSVKRLQHINQYGIIQLVDSGGHNNEPYTRYDHSLGVLYLLNYFGAPFNEQVSGLLHDVSHTTFSHVSDYLFSTTSSGNPNYHDSLFTVFLQKYGIAQILKQYALTPEDVAPENVQFAMLERELPDLCADRLDYILQGSARRKILTRPQVDQIIKSLSYDQSTSHWYLSDQGSARLLAEASLELNKNIFVTGWGRMLYRWAAEAIKRMIHINDLTLEDISYRMGDDDLWQFMLRSKDAAVVTLVTKMKSAWQLVYETEKASEADVTFENLRCRVVDPRVLVPEGWKRLSDFDPAFKRKYTTEIARCRQLHVVIKTL